MPKHHETKNTEAVTAWCETCKRTTLHSVSGKRRGPCREHAPSGMSKAQEQRQQKLLREKESPRLF